MDKFLNVFMVGLGGFCGASGRYLVTIASNKFLGANFPFGTLIVNVIGAIAIGAIFEVSSKSLNLTNEVKLFLTTGLLGGLTTFSTFSYETVNLLNTNRIFTGSLNIVLNLILCLAGVFLGKYIFRQG